MGRPYQILLPLFSLFLVRVDLTDLSPISLTARITKVYDGDTVLVQSGFLRSKVRFSRIDAPEKGQPFLGGSGSAGEFSKRCLERLLPKSGSVTLKIQGHDIYGRILGEIDSISFKLVEDGCTCLYPHAKFESQQEKYLYLRALMKAKRLKKGLWALGGVEQPKAWRRKNKFRKRI